MQTQKQDCLKKAGRKPAKLYKSKYFLVFYDKTDEDLRYMFDNVREILEFMGKEYNSRNVSNIYVNLYMALRSEEHFITWLVPGEVLRVYLIDAMIDTEELFEQNII